MLDENFYQRILKLVLIYFGETQIAQIHRSMSVRQDFTDECVRFHRLQNTKEGTIYYVKNCSASLGLKHAKHGFFISG